MTVAPEGLDSLGKTGDSGVAAGGDEEAAAADAGEPEDAASTSSVASADSAASPAAAKPKAAKPKAAKAEVVDVSRVSLCVFSNYSSIDRANRLTIEKTSAFSGLISATLLYVLVPSTKGSSKVARLNGRGATSTEGAFPKDYSEPTLLSNHARQTHCPHNLLCKRPCFGPHHRAIGFDFFGLFHSVLDQFVCPISSLFSMPGASATPSSLAGVVPFSL